MSNETPIQYGEMTATYFWDDGSGINGDTGLPASGEPMQKGLFSSPSWPLGTEGFIVHEGEEYEFFIGDRGPGVPSHDCDVLLDIDGKTFADMMGETFDDQTLVVSGGNGHAEVEYFITKWGDGHGDEGTPYPFQQPENKCENAVSEIPAEYLPQEEEEAEEEEVAEDASEEAAEDAEEQQDEAPAAEGQDDSDTGVTAETATNDLSGFGLTGAEGTPSAAGLLTLAIIPAILIALFFAWTRRPAGAHAGAHAGADDDSGKGLMAQSDGRHGIASFLDKLRGK